MRTHSRMQSGDAMRARIVVRVFLIIFSTRYLYCIKKCQTLYKSRRIESLNVLSLYRTIPQL